MAEDIDVAQADGAHPEQGSPLDLPMRDEEGQLRHEFVEAVARAIAAADRPLLCEVVAELHEADLGDLIGALEPEDRVKLVELTGTDFDFSALNEVDDAVREEILEELEPETVAEGVRELESDDALGPGFLALHHFGEEGLGGLRGKNLVPCRELGLQH